MRIALFTYDWPHQKTQRFIFALLVNGYKPDVVIATEYVPRETEGFPVKPLHIGLIDPEEICKAFGIPYIEADHSSDYCVKFLRRRGIDLGVIAGAGILPQKTIDAVNFGIINVHPGLIPEVRGQDSLKWAIYKNETLGVTAHLIDARVDAGRIILREPLAILSDDTWWSLSLRLEEAQDELLIKSLRKVESADSIREFRLLDGLGPAHGRFPASKEAILDLKSYLVENLGANRLLSHRRV